MVNLTGMLPPALGGEKETPPPSYEPEMDLNKTQQFAGAIKGELGLSEDLMEEVEDYVNNPPKRTKFDSPIDAAIDAGYLIAKKISKDKTKYLSGLTEYSPEGNKAIRGMFTNALGADPDWNPTEVAWCATFVSQVLSDLGADPLRSKDRYDRVRADKYRNYGSPVEMDNITEGDIVVLDFDGDGKGDHATFYVGGKDDINNNPDSPYISVLGGNQGDAVNIRQYAKDNILAVRRITYDDIDYEFTKELARDNADFNAFLKKEGEGFDMKSLEENPMSPSNTPMTSRPQGFDEGGLADNDNLDLARSYGVTVVDPEETDQTLKAFGKAAVESLPGISTAATIRDIKEELQEENPSWGKIGLLAAGEVVGMVPGLGDAAQNMVRQGVKRFKTKKGSTYEVKEGNTTVRDKAARKEHPGESGIQPQSVKTIYMPRSELEKFGGVHQNPDIPTEFIPTGSDTAALRLTEDWGPLKAGDILPETEVKFTLDPEVGLNPVEILDFRSPRGIHFGNEITEVMDDVKISPAANREELLADAPENAQEVLGITEKQKEDWRKSKPKRKQVRTPQLQKGLEAYLENEITYQEYLELADNFRPIVPIKEAPELPTTMDIVSSLTPNQVSKGVIGVTKNIEDGTRVASRLDINAYENFDTWVVSLHDGLNDSLSGASIGYGQVAVLNNVSFKTNPKGAANIAKGKGKATIARIFGDYENADPEAVHQMAKEILADPDSEWVQVGMNPFRHSFFYDKADGMPVTEASQIIQVGPLVLAKNVKKVSRDDPEFSFLLNKNDPESIKNYNQGGSVMQEQMEMAFMQEGGIKDDGMKRDPVSGNEIPPGSMANEVRDDIPAMLSEGEYVVPADVLRYYGVNFFENLRGQAKQGLQAMESDGRIGGEPLTPNQVQQNMSGQPMAGAPATQPIAANSGVLTQGQQNNAVQQASALPGVATASQSNQAAVNTFNPFSFSTVGFSQFGPQGTAQTQSITTTKTFVNAENPSDKRVVEYVNGQIKDQSMIQYTQPPYYEQGSAGLTEAIKSFESQKQQPSEGGSGGTGTSDTRVTDPNEWAKDITDPEAWADQNLQGKANSLLSTVELATSVARVNAMAIVAEAQGNTVLADNLRDKAREFTANNPVLNSLPNAWIDGDKIAEDLQKDKDRAKNLFGMKTEEQKQFGLKAEQEKRRQRAQAAAQAKKDREAEAAALKAAQASNTDDGDFNVTDVQIDRDPMGQATMSTTYGSGEAGDSSNSYGGEGSTTATFSATADEADPNDPTGYTADVYRGGLMARKKSKKKK